MALGAQCAEEGPFFSTTPRAVIQNGIAISQDILIMPDWLLIGLMMASLLLLMIILIIGLVSLVFLPNFIPLRTFHCAIGVLCRAVGVLCCSSGVGVLLVFVC